MVRPIEVDVTGIAQAGTGVVASAPGFANPFKGLGHDKWSAQALFNGAGGAPSATVLLEGSNDNANWNTVLTMTANGNGTFFATEVSGKAYKFYRVRMSAVNNLTLQEVHVYGTGNYATA